MAEHPTTLIDVAPITVQEHDGWSSKVFNRHLGAIHFAQAQQERHPYTLVTPVIDVRAQGQYAHIKPRVLKDFAARTSLKEGEGLHLIDESRCKYVTEETQYGYAGFLERLDGIVPGADIDGNLVREDGRIVAFSGRLSCTLAELLVYGEKVQIARQREGAPKDDILFVTGYDESYMELYGPGSAFRASTGELVERLAEIYGGRIGIVSFMYSTAPSQPQPTELTKEYGALSAQERRRLVAGGALYALASAHLLEQGSVPDDATMQGLRHLSLGRCLLDGMDALERIIAKPLRTRQDLDGKAHDAYRFLVDGKLPR